MVREVQYLNNIRGLDDTTRSLSQLNQRTRDLNTLFGKTINNNLAETVTNANKGGIGKATLGRGLAGVAAVIEAKKAYDAMKEGRGLDAMRNATEGAIAGYGAIPASKINPFYWTAVAGTLPAHILESYRNRQIEKKYGLDEVQQRIIDNIAAGKNPMDGINVNPDAVKKSFTNNNSKTTATTTGGGYGVTGNIGNMINDLTAQNGYVQPEGSTINSEGINPQNKQSILGGDLSSLLAQYNTANQDYINRLAEFANNYQQNVANDNRRNMALAMIARGTHNPYLMQTSKANTNQDALAQLELYKKINQAKNEPMEKARMAAAYASIGLPPELAYVSEKALTPYATIQSANARRQNTLDTLNLRRDLAQYNAQNRLLQLEQQYKYRRQLQELAQQFKTSPEAIEAAMLGGYGGMLTDEQAAYLFGKRGITGMGGGEVPQGTPTTQGASSPVSLMPINKDME